MQQGRGALVRAHGDASEVGTWPSSRASVGAESGPSSGSASGGPAEEPRCRAPTARLAPRVLAPMPPLAAALAGGSPGAAGFADAATAAAAAAAAGVSSAEVRRGPCVDGSDATEVAASDLRLPWTDVSVERRPRPALLTDEGCTHAPGRLRQSNSISPDSLCCASIQASVTELRKAGHQAAASCSSMLWL